jgi:hypothetical protein
MPGRLFRDRRDGGCVPDRLLENTGAAPLSPSWGSPWWVPVAYEAGTALGAPRDVLLVRKLRVPGREGLAMGAIAGGGVLGMNDDVVRGLGGAPESIQCGGAGNTVAESSAGARNRHLAAESQRLGLAAVLADLRPNTWQILRPDITGLRSGGQCGVPGRPHRGDHPAGTWCAGKPAGEVDTRPLRASRRCPPCMEGNSPNGDTPSAAPATRTPTPGRPGCRPR